MEKTNREIFDFIRTLNEEDTSKFLKSVYEVGQSDEYGGFYGPEYSISQVIEDYKK